MKMRQNEHIRAALYARVSTDQQAQAQTISSQVEALQHQIRDDGLTLDPQLCFIDEGHSGSTLIRPALEKLRDTTAAGAIDRLYVHSPDRLARKYAYQVVLVDEFHQCGVELIFLNRKIGESAEDDLLLQVQRMVAEYERAKILERSRRGKLHAANQGSVNVLSCAPYGYRYVSKQEGAGVARYDVFLEEARIVRQVFTWVGQERLSLGEVCRRLIGQEIRTRTGKSRWDRSTIYGILKNPAYKGTAFFGKRRVGARLPRLRSRRGQPEHGGRSYSLYNCAEQGISIEVPAIVSEELFASVAEQLVENRERARCSVHGARYLLQGLTVCAGCGFAYCGETVIHKKGKKVQWQCAYYRCAGGRRVKGDVGTRVCRNRNVRTNQLESAVWEDVCTLLRAPERVATEYNRRLTDPSEATSTGREALTKQIERVRKSIARLIDAYSDGLLNKSEFEPRIRTAKERLAKLEQEEKEVTCQEQQEQDLRLVIGRLEEFAERVRSGLELADWQARREIVRSVVKRIEIDENKVRVVYRTSPSPFVESPGRGNMEDCLWRNGPAWPVLHEPEILRLFGKCKDLEIIETAMLVGLSAKENQAGDNDLLRVHLDRCWRGHERLIRAGQEHVVRLRIVEGDLLGLE